MNQRDRHDIKELSDRIHEIEKANLKTYYSVSKILSILEDDANTSRKGIVSEVKQLNEDVEKLMFINKNIRRVSIFFMSILSALATLALKTYFFGKDA